MAVELVGSRASTEGLVTFPFTCAFTCFTLVLPFGLPSLFEALGGALGGADEGGSEAELDWTGAPPVVLAVAVGTLRVSRSFGMLPVLADADKPAAAAGTALVPVLSAWWMSGAAVVMDGGMNGPFVGCRDGKWTNKSIDAAQPPLTQWWCRDESGHETPPDTPAPAHISAVALVCLLA